MGTLAPAQYDLTIEQGASFRQLFTINRDMNGYEVVAQACRADNGRKIFDFTVEWVDRAFPVPDTDPQEYEGQFYLVADWQSTLKLKENAQWDLLILDCLTGERQYYVDGAINVGPSVTRGPASCA